MHPIISVVGKSESGKTTLLEKLVVELKKRGIRVAVIKHAAGEGFELDREGSDTWRFSRAGTDIVAISSAHKVAIIRQTQHDLSAEEVAQLVGWDCDLVLTEGFKQSKTPKIEVHRKAQGPGLISLSDSLLAVVTDEPVDVNVPQFSKEDITGLADLIEQKMKTIPQAEDVELLVNDAQVPLNPIVKDTLARVLLAMVSGMDVKNDIRSLRITLRRKP